MTINIDPVQQHGRAPPWPQQQFVFGGSENARKSFWRVRGPNTGNAVEANLSESRVSRKE